MKKTIWILTFAIVLVTVFSGCKKDQNTIAGTINYKDVVTGNIRIADNAKVYLVDPNGTVVMNTRTDDQGKYMFSPVPDGEYHVEATKSTNATDYSGKSNAVQVKGSDVVDLSFTLKNHSTGIYGQAIIVENGTQFTSSNTKVAILRSNDNTPLNVINCDQNGYFYFKNLEPGTYNFVAHYQENNVEYWGYVDSISFNNGEVKRINIYLTEYKK